MRLLPLRAFIFLIIQTDLDCLDRTGFGRAYHIPAPRFIGRWIIL